MENYLFSQIQVLIKESYFSTMWNWLGDEFFIHAFEEILLSSNRHFEVVNCSKQFVRTRILTTQSKVKASLPY